MPNHLDDGEGRQFLTAHYRSQMSAIVKDYQMPAIELGLADYLGVWGRRQIILRGGNRGVVATSVR